MFDSGLLALGNLMLLAGLAFLVGAQRCFALFFQRHKLRGTLFFIGGIFAVFLRFPIIGMILETYGFFHLFRDFYFSSMNPIKCF
ncbi:unnamed protein product [Protopolystoma xenopodis]|uniref:Vesicle transport protein n=1 Tax=Protopolystoma xenopodis TaxID=117903 RepID=A0A448X4H7_9PLAT|nr:unnamed protein product [Protopolystoma xenopodis]